MKTRVGLIHLRYLCLAALVLVIVTGCEQNTGVRATPTTNTTVPTVTQTSVAALSTLTQKWKIKPGNNLDTTPAAVDGVIYATIEDTCICAFDAETGQTNWEVSPPGVGLTDPVVVGGLVYVGMYGDWQLEPEISQTSYLYAFDARTGDGRWRFKGDSAEDESASLPVVVDGLVYVGTGHADGTGRTPPAGFITALDATTGQVVWQITTSGSESQGVVVEDGLVFFNDGYDYNSNVDHLHAVDARTGKEVWVKMFDSDMGSLPFVRNDLLYLGGDGNLVVFDAQTGQEEWHTSLPAESFSSPVIEDGTLYFASNQHRLSCIDNCPPTHSTDYIMAIDAGTGSEKWKLTLDNGGGPFYNLTIYDGVLYYTTFRPDSLKAVDAKTGQEEWGFEADDAIFGSPAVADGVIFLGVSNGNLYALLPPGASASLLTSKPSQPSDFTDGQPTVPPASVQEAPARGFRAPDFTLNDVHTNKTVRLSELRGKSVFLNFWATWCAPCKEEMPRIEQLYAKYKGEVEFIGISSSSSDDLQKVTSFIDEGKFSWTFLDDSSGDVGSKYEASFYPISFFIDKDGLIKSLHVGEMEQAEIEANLQAIR